MKILHLLNKTLRDHLSKHLRYLHRSWLSITIGSQLNGINYQNLFARNICVEWIFRTRWNEKETVPTLRYFVHINAAPKQSSGSAYRKLIQNSSPFSKSRFSSTSSSFLLRSFKCRYFGYIENSKQDL